MKLGRLPYVLAGAAACAAALLAAGVTAVAQPASDPVALVNTFVGTSHAPDADNAYMFPGADAPLGMVQWSPDTPTHTPSAGYTYADTAITGFSLTHLSGAGCDIYGDFRFLPTVGAVTDPVHAQQPFAHASESASPGAYAVTLGDPAIRTELTVTQRSGLGAFTFPATAQANLLIDTSSDQAGVSDAHFAIVSAHEISGSATSGAFCGMPNTFTIYFDAQFDHDFTSFGTWQGTSVTPDGPESSGPHSGGWVRFDTTRNRTVKVKVAVSFVSVAGARTNIAAEAKTWDLGTVRAATAKTWRALLSRVRIAGGTTAEQRTFYTALYHVLLHPNVFSDADGRYAGFDGKVHVVPAGHVQYANVSDWDIYRTQLPLLALLMPHETSDVVRTLLDDAHQGGWLPRWPAANDYTGVMAGDSSDPIIAGAYAFGARDFDYRAALAAMRKGATDTTSEPGHGWYEERTGLAEYLTRGYVVNAHTTSVSPVPNGASETLEYALDDFSIARFALAQHDAATYREFMRRSQNWTTLFDTETGLITPRDADGAFVQTPIKSGGQSGFQEGNAYQYTWMIPHDLGGLVTAMGGPAKAVAKLDAFFTKLNAGPSQPYAWLGNEPSIVSPWTYLYANDPAGEERVARQALTTLYNDTPEGLPGNDDLGTMSAWWLWNAIGLYPINPSVPVLLVGSPLFTSVDLDSPTGLHLHVRAPQAADANPYVQSLRVGGAPTTRSWVALPAHGDLRLDYVLGAAPSAWGTAVSDAPPSYPAGPLAFPPATSAAFAPPAPVVLTPGTPSTLSVAVANTGTTNVGVTWSAQVPPQLTLTPASGAIAAAAHGGGAQRVTVTADPSLDAGLYDIPIAGRADNGALLARAVVVAQVARPGKPLPFGYIANFSDGTILAIDPRTRAYGAPVAVEAAPGGVALSPDGTRLYVANQGANSISVVDTASSKVVATVKVGKVPAGITVSPDGKTVWFAIWGDDAVQSITAATLAVSDPIPVGTQPEGVVITPDGSTVYVADKGSNEVTPIDARSHVKGTPFAAGRKPEGLAIAPDGSVLYAADSDGNTVTVVDLATKAVAATIPVGKTPIALGLSPDGALLYVANSGSGSVTPIDTRTRTARRAIHVGEGPFDVKFTRDGSTAFVVNTGDNECVPIDVATGKVGPSLPTGNFPIALVLPR